MPYFNLSQDVFVFTDASFTAGGVVGDTEDLTGTSVTKSLLQIVRKTFFNRQQHRTMSINALSRKFGTSRGTNTFTDVGMFLSTFANETTGFALGRTAQNFGRINRESIPDDGTISINGKECWRPAGLLHSRRVANSMIYLSVSDMDLRGQIKTYDRLGAVRLDFDGPRLTTAGDSCNGCNTCGVCGACAVCGSLNAASIGAVSALLINATSFGMDLFDPGIRLDLLKSGASLPEDVDNVIQRFRDLSSFDTED